MNVGFSRRSVLRAAGAVGLAAAGGLVARGSVLAGDVDAPLMTVRRNEPGTAAGGIFFTWVDNAGGQLAASGVEIADATGTPLWATSSTSNRFVDFQRQSYRGRDVLTWWQGSGGPGGGGSGQGSCVLTGLDHTPITTIGASDEFQPDSHELRITAANTALITAYVTIPGDLSAVGGPVDGLVRNSYAEEVDIDSGTVLRRWSALDHVPLADSYKPVPGSPDQPYDYFHINSISLTPDDHLLISGRHTSALYKVHRITGEVIWRLGGKSNSYAVAPDAVFGFQHHAIFENPRTIRLFDNGSDGNTTLHPSRVAWLRVDQTSMTATLADSMSIPDNAQTTAMGSAQRLPNGNVLVSWGSNPRLSEFSPQGDLLFDAILPSPSYRAFKYTH